MWQIISLPRKSLLVKDWKLFTGRTIEDHNYFSTGEVPRPRKCAWHADNRNCKMKLGWTQSKEDRHNYWPSIAYLICSHSPAHIQDIADLLHFFHTHDMDMDMPMPMPSLLGWQQSDCLSPASTAAAVQVKKNAIGTVFWCSVLALHGHELTTSSTCIFGASLPTCLPQA